MYNSSIKDKGDRKKFDKHVEIPEKAFINDMSKNYMCECFKTCDIVYSEIAWEYGYKVFNESADNEPDSWKMYISNINKLINELKKPTFIIGGKKLSKLLSNYNSVTEISISSGHGELSPCYLYTFYTDDKYEVKRTADLLPILQSKYDKCLDFSCGYGEHLIKFKDFIGCDINRDCITYLSIISDVKDKFKEMKEG